MANHPYIGGSGAIVQAVAHLRRSFPAAVTADTLKKLGIASKNESYLINILKFLTVIDAEGKRTDKAAKAFNLHEDAQFQKAFGQMVKDAYVDLFGLHGETAWSLDTDSLITFFRQADQSSGIVGTRQANTFRTLAALAGHGEAPAPRQRAAQGNGSRHEKSSGKAAKKTKPEPTLALPATAAGPASPLGLTVRVEVNLPADASQDAYDKIFQSLRKNLIDGK
jgi:Family of unknown function (DUF5343)